MPKVGMNSVLIHLFRSLPPPADLNDNHLLERFLANRDEAAFAGLVQRHGRMVMGVCHRILGNVHDSDDVFQAVFFVLARRAKSVVRREALGSWLYMVAYRTALQARSMRDRRRKREVHMADLPEPEMRMEEPRDWQSLLDRELCLLPKKYRSVVVLCDLEGRTRKEAACQLGLKEGTLSSRLATARRLLATRLSKYGLTISGGALAASLSQNTASAKVPVALVWSTSKAATLVAAGQFVGVSVPAVGLMKGAMKIMFLAKLKTVIGTSIVALALGVGGLVYHAELVPGGARAADGNKPKSELEKLRKENELLKTNLQVTLEKIQAQEAELLQLRGQGEKAALGMPGGLGMKGPAGGSTGMMAGMPGGNGTKGPAGASMGMMASMARAMRGEASTVGGKDGSQFEDVETAIKAWQEAKDEESRKKAVNLLEKALKTLKEHPQNPNDGSTNQGQ
ncbi:MAG: sigma-70 family RNA polymerase sigma factor [Gemmataceae bacterium]